MGLFTGRATYLFHVGDRAVSITERDEGMPTITT